MNFSGTTTIQIVIKQTKHQLLPWNFDIVISEYLCVNSLKIVSPQGIILL